MAVNLCFETVEVFKFQSTGVVELCREVVEFVDSGQAVKYGLDVSQGRLETDTDSGLLKVVFPR